MIRYTTVADPEDASLWLVGYMIPGTDIVSVTSEGHSESDARSLVRELNYQADAPARRQMRARAAAYR